MTLADASVSHGDVARRIQRASLGQRRAIADRGMPNPRARGVAGGPRAARRRPPVRRHQGRWGPQPRPPDERPTSPGHRWRSPECDRGAIRTAPGASTVVSVPQPVVDVLDEARIVRADQRLAHGHQLARRERDGLDRLGEQETDVDQGQVAARIGLIAHVDHILEAELAGEAGSFRSRARCRAADLERPHAALEGERRAMQEEIGALVGAHAGVGAEDEVRRAHLVLGKERRVLRRRAPEFNVAAVGITRAFGTLSEPSAHEILRALWPLDMTGEHRAVGPAVVEVVRDVAHRVMRAHARRGASVELLPQHDDVLVARAVGVDEVRLPLRMDRLEPPYGTDHLGDLGDMPGKRTRERRRAELRPVDHTPEPSGAATPNSNPCAGSLSRIVRI